MFSPLGPTGSLDFYSVTPCRVFDTRSGAQALISGVPRNVQITGLCSIPPDAVAVSLNLTAISPSSNGWIMLFPSNDIPQLISTLNFSNGMNRTNNAIAFLATDQSGTLGAQALLDGGGQVDLVLDVNGFFR
ncbi:MAG: hypothetical protein ABJC13_03815 [Acidobacteriota bacterium]